MEKVKCPNPKCGRRILDIEVMPPGKLVLEMKCRHCGEVLPSFVSSVIGDVFLWAYLQYRW